MIVDLKLFDLQTVQAQHVMESEQLWTKRDTCVWVMTRYCPRMRSRKHIHQQMVLDSCENAQDEVVICRFLRHVIGRHNQQGGHTGVKAGQDFPGR